MVKRRSLRDRPADRRGRRAGHPSEKRLISLVSVDCSQVPSTAASSRSGSSPCLKRSKRATARLFCSSMSCTPSGAGAAEGAVDAANMLKPALRGALRWAHTEDEYRKQIEKDQASTRRFQPVRVGEPSAEDAIAILRGLRERYEVHHGIRIRTPLRPSAPWFATSRASAAR